jgi:hypothetical protein
MTVIIYNVHGYRSKYDYLQHQYRVGKKSFTNLIG